MPSAICRFVMFCPYAIIRLPLWCMAIWPLMVLECSLEILFYVPAQRWRLVPFASDYWSNQWAMFRIGVVGPEAWE